MRKLAFAVSTAYFILLSVELILSFSGKSLCTHSSCLTVDALTLSHKLVVSMGALYFGLFLLLLCLRSRLIILLGFSALASEAVFLLRQALEYRLFCPFCLIVGAGVISTAILSFIIERVDLDTFETAFFMLLSFVAAFTITKVPLEPIRESRVLIYSPTCPHCEKVLEYCKSKGIDVSLCKETNVRGLLYCLGVKGVPALLIRQRNEIKIIEGQEDVMASLNQEQQIPFPFLRHENGLCSPFSGSQCGRN